MGFIIVLLLTTFAIAGSAAGFSVYGLAQIFAGAFIPVVIMGASLEAGKLVAASYVYRFWKDISFLMKSYLISAILVLMLITSAGIFGFLSAAYQTDTLDLRDIESRVVLLEEEKAELYERKKQIDEDITRIGANYITKRMELIDKYSPETGRINNRIPEITKEIHALKSKKIQEESHVGPIIYIAKVFERDTDDATKWMILLIIFAFDPLAVALTIATNNAMLKRQEDKLKKGEITDKEEIQHIRDEAHEAYELGGMSKEKLREFDELTDIVEEREVLTVEDFSDEEVEQLEETHMSEEHEHLNEELVDEPEPKVETPEEVEKEHVKLIAEVKSNFPNYNLDHVEETLNSLHAKEKKTPLSKQEQQQKHQLMSMLRKKVPTVKGGDDEHFITGEAKK